MIDKTKIESGMYGLVGLRQPYNPAYALLDAYNIASRSGYYSSDNPFCKPEFIYDGLDYVDSSAAQFNDYVKKLQYSAISEVANLVFDDVDYIDRNLLFKNEINLTNTETLPSGFVGYGIRVSKKKNIAFDIKRIVLNFKNTGTITLYLFNSNNPTPLYSETITISSENQIEELNWVVDNTEDYYKGSFYIGYLTSEMTGTLEPFKRDYRDSINQSIFTYLDIQNVYVPNVTTGAIWDLSTAQFSIVDSFGLNPDITVYYDYTDLMLNNDRLFARAIDLSFQIKIINSYITSSRSNRNERISAELIQKAVAEIEGISQAPGTIRKIGLKVGLIQEIEALKVQIKKIKEGYFGSKDAIQVITLS